MFAPRLFPYQLKTVSQVYDHIRAGKRRVLLVAPTGSGKTNMGACMARDAVVKGRQAVFVVHRDTLVDQTIETFKRWGLSCGAIAGGRSENRAANVQICSFQTLGSRDISWLNPGLVLVDECHTNSFTDIMLEWFPKNHYDPNEIPYIGLTATPFRLNKRESLGEIFHALAIAPSYKELIAMGNLVKPIYYEVPNSSAGDMIVDTGYMIESWKAIAQNSPTIAFTQSVHFAEVLAEEFNKAGISAASVTENVSRNKRNAIFKAFEREEVKVLSSCIALCLDTQTEILTSDGWVSFDKITYGHQVANWSNGEIFFSKPQNIVFRERQPYERMVRFHSESVDLRVTDNHLMVTQWKGCQIKKVAASDLVGNRVRIPVSGMAAPSKIKVVQAERGYSSVELSRAISANSYNLRKTLGLSLEESKAEARRRIEDRAFLCYKNPHELSVAECAFIGFWIGDGSVSKLQSGGVEYRIAQSHRNSRVIEYIENILKECDFDFVTKIRQPSKLGNQTIHSHTVWSLCRGTGFGSQKRKGLYSIEPYLTKDVNPLFWGLNDQQFAFLIEGFWLADGNHLTADCKPNNLIIHNTNYELLSQLQAIAVTRGYTAKIVISRQSDVKRNWKTLYALSLRFTSHTTINNCYFESEYQDELVWCVTTESKNIVVRRNGKVAVVGNCEGFDVPKARVAILARNTQSRALFVQATGRVMRAYTYPDGTPKTDCIILDQMGVVKRFGFIEDIVINESVFNIDDSDPGNIPTKTCPVCKRILPLSAKRCDRCGYEFEGVAKDRYLPDGKMRRIFRDNVERTHYATYVRMLQKAFSKKLPLSWADRSFLEKFNYFPPSDWRRNAIIRNADEATKAEFKEYLQAIAAEERRDPNWITRQLSLELGL